MKKLAAIALVLTACSNVRAEATDRQLAGQKDFTSDYLEKVSDEKAAEQAQREQDRKEHLKYLRMIDRAH
jgi:hypothetical protein